ncbi:MAG: Exopolysaccharide biosynthesis polyprenyl glycosylphosphotransferase, partial [Parcubacteria group bacterium GW2011_GWA2_47_10]
SHTYQNYYTGNKFSTSTQIQDDEALAELAKEEHAGNLPYPFFSSDEDLERVIKTHAIDTIVVSKNIKENKTLVRMFFDIIPYGVTIIDFPEFYENITGKIPVSLIGEVWFLEHLVEGQKTLFESAKQVTDLFLAILLALPTIAILPFLAVAIRLDSKGPIFYRQQRVSRRKKIIEIIKLRTMVADAEKDGVRWADENDMRVTRVGRFLRKTRLDELPQLWSVLKGDLSLVGPRPERPEFVEILRTEIPFYDMRLLVKPGLTGWAQVNFPYGASVEDSMEKLQYDLFYIKNRSVILDISTMLKTLLIIISRGGR